MSLLTMPGWWLGTASARQVVLWNFGCAPERMALTFLLPSGSHQSLTATNVPLLSSPRGAPRGPWSREEAVTTFPDAPKATCHSHPVTHHPVCVPPHNHRHSRADLVQTLTERERGISASPSSPLPPPPGTGQADPSWTEPNYSKAGLRVCRRTGLPGDRNQSMGHKFNSTFPLPPAPCSALGAGTAPACAPS